jgi:mannose-6-phosphate isomerase-like protein (cupin superfamily)
MRNGPAPTREVLTTGDTRTVIERLGASVDSIKVVSGAERLVTFDIADERIQPANYDKPDGAPLRMLDSEAAKVDVSKRSVHDMAFWHRSTDYSEVIICVQGALRWETELGTHLLRPGQVLYIPRGVAHRSALCAESAEENVLIEVKIKDDCVYTGPEVLPAESAQPAPPAAG